MKQNVEFKTALNLILNSVNKKLRTEFRNVKESLWYTCAVNVKSKYDIPNYDNSAMDGFAIRSTDTQNAKIDNPIKLKIVGEIKAGKVSRLKISSGECVSVMTGSCLPQGADAVIEKEAVEYEDNKIKIFSKVKPNKNIRFCGEDVKKNEVVVEKGTLITPSALGMIISCGYDKIKVYRKPKIGIIATGDELVDVGEKVTYGKVRNVNSYTLSGLVEKYHFKAYNYGIAKDEVKQLKSKLTKALAECDVILISGGVSKGEYDLVKPVLLQLEVKPIFWQVKQRPGKPVFYCIYYRNGQKIPIFGVPGNVVSNYIVFEMLIKPLLYKLEGRNEQEQYFDAIIEEPVEKKLGLRYFLRGVVVQKNGKFYVRTTGPQGSGILMSLLRANCLIVLDERQKNVKKGDTVKIKFI
ncbi:MAG: molybdopterin molybdotransferase MoeA [Endomicrobia bacterium]|nr:molybdopterin molybdotransferase MoeA [Endomicrobiia bacterium]MCX7940838.1 molybdopterin molybdotransferase MoeA [Endomicrobiia bacterium]MDW8055520.1 molybdopterin molybdotransferase MoeA [Elusimicrobiota bacterium]